MNKGDKHLLSLLVFVLAVLCAWFCCERPQTKTQGSCGFVFNHNAAKHHHSVHCWLIWTPFLLLVVLMNQTKDTLDVLCGFVGAVKILEQSNVLCVLWTRMQEQAYKLGNGRRVCVLSMFTVGVLLNHNSAMTSNRQASTMCGCCCWFTWCWCCCVLHQQVLHFGDRITNISMRKHKANATWRHLHLFHHHFNSVSAVFACNASCSAPFPSSQILLSVYVFVVVSLFARHCLAVVAHKPGQV